MLTLNKLSYKPTYLLRNPISSSLHLAAHSHLTIYGLRRSPKHWFDKAAASMKSIGLTQSPYAPCIFHGGLLPNKPKLYLGMYVDDLLYFSSDPDVEAEFEK